MAEGEERTLVGPGVGHTWVDGCRRRRLNVKLLVALAWDDDEYDTTLVGYTHICAKIEMS